MKRNGWISGIAAIVVGGGIAVSAQSTTSSAQTDQKSITVTGCLQPANAAPGKAGTSGTTAGTTTGTTSSSSTASERFMLTNARLGTAMSSSTAASTTGSTAGTTSGTTTSGTTAGHATDATGASYMLEGKTSDLRNHVNHQIEVTGRLDASRSTTGSSATTAGSTTAGTPTSSASRTPTDGPRLQVESVRMISATCPAR